MKSSFCIFWSQILSLTYLYLNAGPSTLTQILIYLTRVLLARLLAMCITHAHVTGMLTQSKPSRLWQPGTIIGLQRMQYKEIRFTFLARTLLAKPCILCPRCSLFHRQFLWPSTTLQVSRECKWALGGGRIWIWPVNILPSSALIVLLSLLCLIWYLSLSEPLHPWSSAEIHGFLSTQIKMQWLAKLAIMSGRVPVWPTVDCSVSYADGRNQSLLQSEPPAVPESWIPYWSHSWKKVHCYFMPLFEPGMSGFVDI